MKFSKIIFMVLLVAFVGIQFIPTKPNKSYYATSTDFMLVYDVPTELKLKIKVSCYDCHSNNTNYPWYNKIQPIAWILENHINEGKSDLNFSDWGNYSDRRKKSKLKSIISQINDEKMPLASYTIIHGDAKFSDFDKKNMIDWIDSLNSKKTAK